MAGASFFRGTFGRTTLIAGGTFAVVVLVFTLAVLFLHPRPTPEPFDPVSAHAEWQQEVRAIADEIGVQHPSSDRLRELRETMLTFRVTAEDRDAHLRFILALLALERGDADADRSFAEARDAILQTP